MKVRRVHVIAGRVTDPTERRRLGAVRTPLSTAGVIAEAPSNVPARTGDPGVTRYTPHQRVQQLLRERADRHRTRLPIQDSSRDTGGGERNIQPRSATSNE